MRILLIPSDFDIVKIMVIIDYIWSDYGFYCCRASMDGEHDYEPFEFGIKFLDSLEIEIRKVKFKQNWGIALCDEHFDKMLEAEIIAALKNNSYFLQEWNFLKSLLPSNLEICLEILSSRRNDTIVVFVGNNCRDFFSRGDMIFQINNEVWLVGKKSKTAVIAKCISQSILTNLYIERLERKAVLAKLIMKPEK